MSEMPEAATMVEEEIKRIRAAYNIRDADPIYRARYTYLNPTHLFTLQAQERALLLALTARLEVTDLSNKRILDVGCGTGGTLINFLRYGARPENLVGVDLMPQRILQARQRLPVEVDLRCQDAQQLPFPDESFDLVG